MPPNNKPRAGLFASISPSALRRPSPRKRGLEEGRSRTTRCPIQPTTTVRRERQEQPSFLQYANFGDLNGRKKCDPHPLPRLPCLASFLLFLACLLLHTPQQEGMAHPTLLRAGTLALGEGKNADWGRMLWIDCLPLFVVGAHFMRRILVQRTWRGWDRSGWRSVATRRPSLKSAPLRKRQLARLLDFGNSWFVVPRSRVSIWSLTMVLSVGFGRLLTGWRPWPL